MLLNKAIVFELEMQSNDEETIKQLIPDFNESSNSLKKDKILGLIDKEIRKQIKDEFHNQQPVKGLKINFETFTLGKLNRVLVKYEFNKDLTQEIEDKLTELTDLIAREFIKDFHLKFNYIAWNMRRYQGEVKAVKYSITRG